MCRLFTPNDPNKRVSINPKPIRNVTASPQLKQKYYPYQINLTLEYSSFTKDRGITSYFYSGEILVHLFLNLKEFLSVQKRKATT